MALLSLTADQSSLWWMRITLYLMGFGVGQVFVATQAAAFAAISSAASGRASTLFNVGRRLGGAIGVAVSTTVIVLVGVGVRSPGGASGDLAAYPVAFLVAAAINVSGGWAAW